jgi:formamidopyrimidine-DNA glycosylase
MPELPEVETMRRGILGVVNGMIRDVQPLPCSCRPIRVSPAMPAFRRRTVGHRIESVDRLGKRVAIRLDSGDTIVIEPRMTGLLLVADPPDDHHLRVRLDIDGCSTPHVWYWDRRGLGSVRLLSPGERERKLGTHALGPDALTLDAEQLALRLGSSRREIKVALLDQRAIAGIGNLYASEILHVAAIHPQRRCDQLRPVDWHVLLQAMAQVLRDAIEHEGSTLSDGTYRNALNQAGGYQHHHRVYGRSGETCSTCGVDSVERIVQAQRSTFFCPRCQRMPRSRAIRVPSPVRNRSQTHFVDTTNRP